MRKVFAEGWVLRYTNLGGFEMLLVCCWKGFRLKVFFVLFGFIFYMVFVNSSYEANEIYAYDKYCNLAIKLQKQKKYKEADEVFSIGISKYPSVAKLYFLRAKLRQGYIGNCSSAIQDYTIVLKLNEKEYHPKSYYMRGLCFYKFKLYQYAIGDFSNCLRLAPNYGHGVYLDRAKAYAKLNMIEKAKNDLEHTLKTEPKYAQKAKDLLKIILAGKKDF